MQATFVQISVGQHRVVHFYFQYFKEDHPSSRLLISSLPLHTHSPHNVRFCHKASQSRKSQPSTKTMTRHSPNPTETARSSVPFQAKPSTEFRLEHVESAANYVFRYGCISASVKAREPCCLISIIERNSLDRTFCRLVSWLNKSVISCN